jgi:ribonuclease HII
MTKAKVRCRSIHVAAVFPAMFNRHIDATDNKAAACSQISLNLLRSFWNPEDEPAYVVADRHGGRARYDQLLTQTFEGLLPMRLSESPVLSRYRLCDSEVRFECRAERHFPVAAASIIAKYVRELSMRMFNDFWRGHVPDVKPTQGYPGDSRRFANDVAEARATLGIPDHAFWRAR